MPLDASFLLTLFFVTVLSLALYLSLSLFRSVSISQHLFLLTSHSFSRQIPLFKPETLVTQSVDL